MNEQPTIDQVDSRIEELEGTGAGGGAVLYLEALIVTAVALIVRLVQLDHTPFVDELNHVLAARSLLEQGTLTIEDGGVYSRAWAFTYLVAAVFRVAGESLAAARIPAVLAGTALVTAIFLWVRSVAGRPAAWVAALLFCFYPASIWLSQLCRFYTLQTLFLWIGAIAIYRIASGSLSRRDLLRHGPVALFGLVVAMHFQILSLIGTVGVALWGFVAVAPELWRRLGNNKVRFLVIGALSIAALIVFAWAWRSGTLHGLWHRARYADLWARGSIHSLRYYHWLILHQYPTLWTLAPLLTVVAIAARPKPASFCAVVFAAAIAIQSMVAWKAERYIFYAMPFFFALVGISLVELLPWVVRQVEGCCATLSGRRIAGGPARFIGWLLVVFALLFAGVGNEGISLAHKMLTVSDADWSYDRLYRGEPNWAAVRDEIAPIRTDETVIVSSSDLKALYYLERLDYILSRDQISSGLNPGPEFSRAWKTGRMRISEPESIEQIMTEHRSGIVLVEEGQWRRHWGVMKEVADFLEARLEPVPLPEGCRVLAFRWESP